MGKRARIGHEAAKAGVIPSPATTTLRAFRPDERCRFRGLSGGGLRVVIRLTYRCDMACPHCLVGSRAGAAELGYGEWRRVLSGLPGINARKVLLTGGEPLLHPDLLRIVSLVSRMGIPVDLNTNMQRMTKTLMVELQRAGLTEISVALEGPGEIHDSVRRKRGAFAQTMQAIKWAAQAGIQVDASCCLTTENYAGLEALLDMLKGMPIQSFTISRLFPIGHGSSDVQKALPQQKLSEIYDDLTQHWVPRFELPIRLVGLLGCPRPGDCERGRSLIGITPEGQVVACVLAPDSPAEIPHPLEVGLKRAVIEVQRQLGERHYRLCCEGIA
jgi:MoaA/NifB/PqqE/SkfB family radical SAM enzyme